MKVKKVKKNPDGVKVVKEFVFKLTTQEKADCADQMANLDSEIEDLELRFEEVKKNHRAKIDSREDTRRNISACVNAGEEKRTVDAVMVKDFEAKEIRYYFEGNVLEARTMTPNELQMEVDFNKGKKKTRATKQTLNKPTEKHDPVAEAHAATANGKIADIAEVRKLETSRGTKTSAVDGPTRM